MAGILITITTLLLIFKDNVQPSGTSRPYQTHITSDLSIEYSPDISPNNKFIAYTWNGGKGNQWNIYLKQIGLDGSKRFTHGPGSDQSASWSNAGDKIAFFQKRPKGWLLSFKTFLGEEERALYEIRSVWKTAGGITWAADDKSIVFSALKYGSEEYTLNRIDLDDLSVTEIKVENEWDYTMPRYSPDHKLIATVAHRGVRVYQTDIVDSIISKLQVIEAATGKLVLEKLSQKEISNIDWRTNSSLIFTAGSSTVCRVYEVNLDDDQPGLIDFDKTLPILTIPDVVRSISYHAPSNDLYLERWRADVNIWKAKYQEGQITENAKAIGSTLFDFSPKLNPDETKIAYISNKSNKVEIWLHDLKSGLSKQVTNLKGYPLINSIDWSHDGSKLVASLKNRKEDAHAVIIDTLGHEVHRMEHPKGIHRPVWSKDDDEIYAIVYDAKNQPGIWHYKITSGEWAQFSDIVSDFARVMGDYVYYMKPDLDGLWRTTIAPPHNPELVSPRLMKARAEYWTIRGDTLKMINIDFESSFLEIIHIPSQKLISSTPINNYIPMREAGATFTKNNEVFFSSIDNYDSDIVKVKLTQDLE